MASFKSVLGRGLTLAVPIAVVGYVLIRMVGIFEDLISPLAHRLGIARIWGSITLTIFAILLLFGIVLLLGLMMRMAVIAALSDRLETLIFRFFPSLNQFKLMASDKLELDNALGSWKPVLVFLEEKYNAAFVIEEDAELVTLFVCKMTSLHEGEIMTIARQNVQLISVDYGTLSKYSKAYGKGYISLIRKTNQSGKSPSERES